ncbi:hypothetical protein ACWF0M_21110 [Kribbella sp. NPDC055110]
MMNLQDLRDELTARAASADQHSGDLLPGVQHKIHRTKQRRAFAALGVVAVIAAVAASLVPTLRPTPPADNPPEDYTRDGLTVPGTVGSDKLLKAWIGDRGQSSLSFSWTPTTDSIAFHSNCETTGSGMYAVRYRINGWIVGVGGCDTGPDAWTIESPATARPDDALWLSAPVGKAVQVTAEVFDMDTKRPGAENARISLGIYSTSPNPPTGNGAPARIPPVDAGAYQKDGVVYRKTVGGDTLAAAKVADPGRLEVRFSFTATGAKLALRPFCTANAGSDGENPPYTVEMRIGPGQPFKATCAAYSIDAAKGGGLTIASPVPAGQRVDVVAKVLSTDPHLVGMPPDVRLGLGIYFQGPQRVIDGVELPEQTEVAGYRYRLAEVKTAPGPDRHLATETPADQPYLVAYGGSPLGTGGFRASLTVGKTETGVGVAPDVGGMGIGWDAHGAAPSERATLTIAEGKPTKGTLILAIYLPD